MSGLNKNKTFEVKQTYANRGNTHNVCTVGFVRFKKGNNSTEMSRTKE